MILVLPLLFNNFFSLELNEPMSPLKKPLRIGLKSRVKRKKKSKILMEEAVSVAI